MLLRMWPEACMKIHCCESKHSNRQINESKWMMMTTMMMANGVQQSNLQQNELFSGNMSIYFISYHICMMCYWLPAHPEHSEDKPQVVVVADDCWPSGKDIRTASTNEARKQTIDREIQRPSHVQVNSWLLSIEASTWESETPTHKARPQCEERSNATTKRIVMDKIFKSLCGRRRLLL